MRASLLMALSSLQWKMWYFTFGILSIRLKGYILFSASSSVPASLNKERYSILCKSFLSIKWYTTSHTGQWATQTTGWYNWNIFIKIIFFNHYIIKCYKNTFLYQKKLKFTLTPVFIFAIVNQNNTWKEFNPVITRG